MARKNHLQRKNENRNAISKRLRLARAMHDPPLTQEGLCEKLQSKTGIELHASTVAKIETDVRSVYDFEVIALAQVLNVTNDWLLGVSNEGGPVIPDTVADFTRTEQ